jgi:hypothetical protein
MIMKLNFDNSVHGLLSDYSFTCLLRFMSVCCLSVVVVVVVTDENWNSSTMPSPIELKLSGDLGLVSQISVHALF